MQIMQWYNPKTRAENTGYLYTYATGCKWVSEKNSSRILGEQACPV
jgi:hypothetical protein